jgi:hypothetical protein
VHLSPPFGLDRPKISASIHFCAPFDLDRALITALITALINHAPISAALARAHFLPSPQPPLSAGLHFFAFVCLTDAPLFPPFAFDRPPISALIPRPEIRPFR